VAEQSPRRRRRRDKSLFGNFLRDFDVAARGLSFIKRLKGVKETD